MIPSTLLMMTAILAEAFLKSSSYSDGPSIGASASFTVGSNGVVSGTGSSVTANYNWLIRGSAADYEVRVVATGDAPSGSATNTWLALSSNRTWSYSASGDNEKAGSFAVEIRLVGTTTVLASATFTMTATSVAP